MSTFVFLSPNQISDVSASPVDEYLDLITSQHRKQPKFISWLASALAIVNDGITVTKNITSNFDIDTAVGVQLDVIGEIVGLSRVLRFQPSDGSPPVLDDTSYRIALKAKIAQNQWDGTIPQVYEIWDSLFPDIGLRIVDNQNMTMSALVDGQLDAVTAELIASGYIIPKPVGVGLTIIGTDQIQENAYIGVLVNEMDIVTVSTNIP